jgi:hypothetical protein
MESNTPTVQSSETENVRLIEQLMVQDPEIISTQSPGLPITTGFLKGLQSVVESLATSPPHVAENQNGSVNVGKLSIKSLSHGGNSKLQQIFILF